MSYIAVGGTRPKPRKMTAEEAAKNKAEKQRKADEIMAAARNRSPEEKAAANVALNLARANASRIVSHSGGQITVIRDVTPEAIAENRAIVDEAHPLHPDKNGVLSKIPGGIYTVGGGVALVGLVVFLKMRKKTSVAPKRRT